MTHRAASRPRHRATAPARHRAPRPPRSRGRWLGVGLAAVGITVAVVATGVAVVGDPSGTSTTYLAAALVGETPAPTPGPVEDRSTALSRSTQRVAIDDSKQALLSQESGGQVTKVADLRSTDPRGIAKAMLAEFGFATSSFSCLDQLWSEESGWRVEAENRNSGAYGIPQALPGNKMASAGSDWRTSAETQIRWGLGYIKARYGTLCAALEHKHSRGWY